MKFAFDDDTVLVLSGVASSIYGLQFVAAPKQAHEFYYEKAQPFDEATSRWFGYALGGHAAYTLTVSQAKNAKAVKKDVLKTCGVGWLGSVAMHLYNTHEGTQKKEIAYGCAALGAVMGAVCLWRGCKKVEEEEAPPAKKK